MILNFIMEELFLSFIYEKTFILTISGTFSIAFAESMQAYNYE